MSRRVDRKVVEEVERLISQAKLKVKVAEEDGRVLIAFDRATDGFTLTPEDAITLASTIVSMAKKLSKG